MNYQVNKSLKFVWISCFPDAEWYRHVVSPNILVLCVIIVNPGHSRAGQHFHNKGPCRRQFVWFHLMPPPPRTELIGRTEATGTETALSWWPGLCTSAHYKTLWSHAGVPNRLSDAVRSNKWIWRLNLTNFRPWKLSVRVGLFVFMLHRFYGWSSVLFTPNQNRNSM